MIRPLQGQVLVRIIPKVGSKTVGGIEIPAHTVTPEEQQELNHNPRPPEPILGKVQAIGPWKKLDNGLAMPPPFPAGATILMRPGSGKDLSYGAGDKWKLVNTEDILAVVEETS